MRRDQGSGAINSNNIKGRNDFVDLAL